MYSSEKRYHPYIIIAHWLTLVLLIAVYALVELKGFFPKGSDPREAMKTWHFMLGMWVWLIVLARLWLHYAAKTPPITPAPPAWQMSLARFFQLLLYAFLLVMPVLGYLVLSAKGSTIPFFGLELPAIISADKELASSLKEIHETLGKVGYFIIGFHAFAAIYHHHFMKDNTLERMLPSTKDDD